jgi:hypothetical protein
MHADARWSYGDKDKDADVRCEPDEDSYTDAVPYNGTNCHQDTYSRANANATAGPL